MLVGIGSRIEKEVYNKIVKEAKENKTTRSEIIRHHLKNYYKLKEKHGELFKVFNRMHSEIERLQKENESLKTKVKELKERHKYILDISKQMAERIDFYQNRVHQLEDERDRLKTKVKNLERILEYKKELEEKERKNRLWKWLKEHFS